ncbi:type VII secretion-associated serine protease mycosin [Streptomyces sp. LX-29]|uniref:type VII secretion-associated serine protease mycosin n=1 Tax=Streptomyces sp. LX-29 TaxID=2900152 RepID=UPI00240D8151|nr:type VII secretion-associated serine protease mycosin [Streptomyces sp. LX-29]WFB11536.1 type VII secretion-associated serine protease mycosin [Streptomyces sp. LX-29]
MDGDGAPRRSRAAGLAATAALIGLTGSLGMAEPAAAAGRGPGPASASTTLDGNGECTFPMKKQIKGTPWPLQRIVLDQLWKDTKGRDPDGRPVRVAVIDTGVDNENPQLKTAVDASSGANYLPRKETERPPQPEPEPEPKDDAKDPKDGKKDESKPKPKPKPPPPPPPKPRDGTDDEVGHGTKAAGIIAARPRPGTGFVGLAPEATIIPLQQNDARGTGTPRTMALAIEKAIAEGAQIINISQDTAGRRPSPELELAIAKAIGEDIVVVASAGNDGADGKSHRTYPASYPGVLAVAASDRNNERAVFSQSGDFIGVAAPGVEIVSTVPKGGQCVDNGTSFSAPYVAGVAALIRAKHPDWKNHQVVAQIEQTAERGVNGRDRYIGWGVVDPVRALNDDERPIDKPTAEKPHAADVKPPQVTPLPEGETPQERRERLATYALGTAGVLVAVTTGGAVVLRDWRRRRGPGNPVTS